MIRRFPLKLKDKFYGVVVRPTVFYGTECWSVEHSHIEKMRVAKMRMLWWTCGHTRSDGIRNEDI